MSVGRGEIVLISGPSGSGKTTLLSMIGGLLRPTSGRIVLDGVDITAAPRAAMPAIRAAKIGFVFQAFNLMSSLTAEQNVLFPTTLVRGERAHKKARTIALLDKLGLAQRRHHPPHKLSGGEKQRVAIARALVNDPPLILADEPTGNLDSASGQQVMMILHDIARDEGRTIVVVTHDPRVEDVADRILWLEDGRLRDRKAETHEWVRDPVCGMRVDAWTATEFLERGGVRHVFCSRRCLERFETATTDNGAARPE